MQRDHVKGHWDTVVSLAVHPTVQHTFCSVADDATCRIWDVKSKQTTHCVFLKSNNTLFPLNSAVAWHPTNQHLLYVSSGSTVYEFDLRQNSNHSLCHSLFSQSFQTNNDDEINAMVLTPRLPPNNSVSNSSNHHQIITCDDSGRINNVRNIEEYSEQSFVPHDNVTNYNF